MFANIQDVNFNRYDVIVAGSGPAGAVVAKTLAAHDKNVLVVESGTSEFDLEIQGSYSVVYGQGNFDSSHWPYHWVRALGGTSAVWNGWLAPLSARNMASWPISRQALDTWYDVAAVELGRSPVICSWRSPAFAGFEQRPFSNGDASRYGQDAGEAIWQNDRIHVLLNTTLSRLHPREDRRGIEKITLFVAPNQKVEVDLTPKQKIVLAAGGMGNPQILLASEDGSGASVGNETDQVGRYLMEHPHIYSCATMVVQRDFNLPTPPTDFGEFTPTLVPDDSTYEATGQIDASFSLSQSDLDEGDAIERFVVDRLGGEAKVFNLNARTEMMADPSNRVERVIGEDPAGLPRLRATCVLNADDYRIILQYLRRIGNSIASSDTGRIKIKNQEIFSEMTGGGHTMGTTRMGNDPKTSVTDGNCRVHGYSNLFIAGSSLFTTGGYANPTLTIVALAARLGDFLRNET